MVRHHRTILRNWTLKITCSKSNKEISTERDQDNKRLSSSQSQALLWRIVWQNGALPIAKLNWIDISLILPSREIIIWIRYSYKFRIEAYLEKAWERHAPQRKTITIWGINTFIELKEIHETGAWTLSKDLTQANEMTSSNSIQLKQNAMEVKNHMPIGHLWIRLAKDFKNNNKTMLRSTNLKTLKT